MSSRSTLKDYFKTNAVPTQNNFSDLMDSVFIQSEDGIRKQGTAPVALEAQTDNNGEQPILHFYKSFADKDAAWKFSLLNQNAANPASGLTISSTVTGQSSLFIKESDGNVGIGISNPVNKLEVNGAIHTNGNPIYLRQGTADKYHFIKYGTENDGVQIAGYGGVSLGYSAGGVGGTLTNVLTVDYNGNVGIGITPASAKLHVKGGNTLIEGKLGIGRITASFPGYPLSFPEDLGDKITFFGQTGNIYGIGVQSYTLQLYTPDTSSNIAFGLGNSTKFTELMRLNGNGNLGIGTNTPQAKLQVTGGAIMPAFGNGKDAGIYFPQNIGGGSGDAAWLRYYIREDSESTTLELGIDNDADDHIALMPSGNVGIGTTIPRSKLDMMAFNDTAAGTLSSVFARLSEGDASGEGTFLGVRAYSTQTTISPKSFAIEHSFYGQVNSSINFCRGGNTTGGFLTFNTNNNKEQLRIDNNGNVTYTGTLTKSSDVRIKQNIAKSNSISDLDTITQLKVKEYHLIDQNTASSSLQKGFIAQEVETVLPAAVIKHNNFIPDIFLPAASAIVNESILTITTSKNHELITGDIVRLITSAGNIEKGIKVISDTAFSVDNWKEDTADIFVYGKKVDDFRSLDYQQIFTLGISAIQELYKQLQQLGKEIDAIKERLSPAFASII